MDTVVPVVKTPAEWAAEQGFRIMDPDGWRVKDAPPFDRPITREEFIHRAMASTIVSLNWFAEGTS